MADVAIDLVPDPARDTEARRAALALVTAAHFDPGGGQGLSSAAMQGLVEQVVAEIGGVREESAAALQAMLTAVARQYSAFTGIAHALAAEAFLAGQRESTAQEPDLGPVLDRVRAAVEDAAEQG